MAAVSGWNFDWDDNIFYMPTDVVLFHKDSGEERPISTAEFATVRGRLGEPGEWQDWQVGDESFRYFRDGPGGRNYFREDVDRAIGSNDPIWMGPSWDPFLFALSYPETAKNVTIITARGHSPNAMMDGLRYLRARGYVRNLPPVENLYPVSNKELFGGDAANPSQTKAKVMQEILDDLSANPVGDDDPTVLDRDGDGSARLHLWGFSDDDWGNFEAARDVLSEQVKAGRWANTKVTIFFTGVHDSEHEPCQLVIRSDGSVRDRRSEELNEGMLATLGVSAVPPAAKAPSYARRKGADLWSSDLFELI